MDKELRNPNQESQGPRRYRSLDELLHPPAESAGEFSWGAAFSAELPADKMSRRRFLSLVSASAALALGTSCSRIDRGKIVPYTKKAAETIPGVATYYASTFQEGLFSHGVLVKTREGRPIHVEGNAEHPLSRGKTSLRAIADVLGLYDPDRLRAPSVDGNTATWSKAEEDITRALREAQRAGKPLLLLTDAVISPTRTALIAELKKAMPALLHASWEPAAPQAEILAAQALYGEFLLPRLRFDRADVILSLQADFLGIDGNAPELIQDFAARRRISGPADPINRLWVMESCMSLTGANADQRLLVRPTGIAPLAFALARYLNKTHGVPLPPDLDAESLNSLELDRLAGQSGVEPAVLHALADDLKRAGKSALVLAGAALPQEAHAACHLLNTMLGADGHTVDTALAPPVSGLLTFAGLRELLKEAAQGRFSAAIFWGANPAYSFPQEDMWRNAAAKIPTTVRIGLYEDETARTCRWRLPEHHWLEAWGDFEPAGDLLSLRQPTIGALHDTRQGEDFLLPCLRALGVEVPSTYHDFLKARWQKEVYPAGSPVDFEAFWNAALHDGVLKRESKPRPPRVPRAGAIREAIQSALVQRTGGAAGDLELVLLPGAAVHDGRYANNGWLNELPDPVTKATWGNPLLLSVSDAERLGFRDEDLAMVTAGSESLQIPVVIQPGQAPGVACLALGYGRQTGNVAAGVGVNAYSLTEIGASCPQLRTGVKIARAAGRRAVPRTQEHHRMEGRDLTRSWTLAEYSRRIAGRRAGKEGHAIASLIPAQDFMGHKWGMAIDLSACVGCSACVVACQSENSVPVVGPEQVQVGREMHWIRIDRYYEGDPGNPSVLHQPILCQQCDHAPCEIVCPVNATTHSPDGLNQMAYNRCVGTRYCSNNCPYKVRRFNFFEYAAMKKAPENLVFNPEVTVRPRGVMEKCTYCIQRIHDVRQRANVEGRPVRDGEITPACAAACPAGAIVFGDLNDPQSQVARMSITDRSYHMLEELGVRPTLTYLADISNPILGKGKA
jgi:Fe-S-cluster-containing dehydrogenase component